MLAKYAQGFGLTEEGEMLHELFTYSMQTNILVKMFFINI